MTTTRTTTTPRPTSHGRVTLRRHGGRSHPRAHQRWGTRLTLHRPTGSTPEPGAA